MKSPSTLPFAVPAYWTSEQALAVYELLDELRALIWAHYETKLIDELREIQNAQQFQSTRCTRRRAAVLKRPP
jgi:hypothetical protein